MKNLIRLCLWVMFFFLGMGLTACSGDSQESVAPTRPIAAEAETVAAPATRIPDTPEPTAVPTIAPTSTATPIPSPTPDLTAAFTGVASERIGVAISYPEAWVSDVAADSGDLHLASDAALLDDMEGSEGIEAGMMVQITSLPQEALAFLLPLDADTNDPTAVLEMFANIFLASMEDETEDASFSERQGPAVATIAGYKAATALYDMRGDKLDGLVKVVAMMDADNGRVVLLFAATPLATEAQYLPLLELMLQTVVLSPPTGAHSGSSDSAGGGFGGGSSAVGMVGSGGQATVHADVPRITPEPGMTHFTNGNQVFDITVHDGLIYAATGGGLVAWDYVNGRAAGQWTTLDGLGHNVTKAITVCALPQERIVIGTKVGLSLYDPVSGAFENWTRANSGMSSDAGVATLACAPQSQALVIGYDLDGVDVYEAGSDTWRYYAPFRQLESGFAEALAVQGDLDAIWVAHITSVSRINHRQGTVDYYHEENGLDDLNTSEFEHFVEDIMIDEDGVVWFAQGGGLTRVDGDGRFTFIASKEITGWPFWSGTDDLAPGADGTIWTNDQLGGICQFDPISVSCLTTFADEPGMADDFNNGLFIDDAGQIFYGSEGEGISYYDGTAWQNFLLDTKLLSNEFRAIAQGADGSIWIGGHDGGQNFFAYDVAGSWQELSHYLGWNSVNTFYPEADGMWLGHTGGAGFYAYGSGQWTSVERAEEAGAGIYQGGVTAIARDNEGRMWFGANGVTAWDGATFVYFDLLTESERSDGRFPRQVNAILVEGSNVWVGGVGVLYRFDTRDNTLQQFTRWDASNGLPGFFPTVYALAQDQDGTLLAAVDRKLLRGKGDDITEVYDAGAPIVSITIDEDGAIALGTDGNGLHVQADGAWLTLTVADGLPSNRLANQGVLIDYLGSFWIAGREGGLLHIAP